MASTRTGGFGIGFRRGWSDWQKDLDAVISFARSNGFEGVDLGTSEPSEIKKVLASGLRIGSVDLKRQAWSTLISPDAGKRAAAVAEQTQYVQAAVAAGARVFFCVLLPEDPARPRKENFDFAVDGFGKLCQAIAPTGAKIVLEGWPGAPPHYASLACTPADYRAFFKAVGSDVVGVNFDPSHLIRMGIDAVRFIDEFVPRVFHVHGKDTEMLDDELYEHGHTQRATFAPIHGFGEHAWRYTIPGHGCARWSRMFRTLVDAGYQGMVSVELEDESFNGTEAGEKRGLVLSREFLAGA